MKPKNRLFIPPDLIPQQQSSSATAQEITNIQAHEHQSSKLLYVNILCSIYIYIDDGPTLKAKIDQDAHHRKGKSSSLYSKKPVGLAASFGKRYLIKSHEIPIFSCDMRAAESEKYHITHLSGSECSL